MPRGMRPESPRGREDASRGDAGTTQGRARRPGVMEAMVTVPEAPSRRPLPDLRVAVVGLGRVGIACARGLTATEGLAW